MCIAENRTNNTSTVYTPFFATGGVGQTLVACSCSAIPAIISSCCSPRQEQHWGDHCQACERAHA
eukprot:2484212-Pyramimonas_sp.AAC.1